MQLIEEHKKELKADELTIKETVLTAWKPYIPAAVSTLASTACIIAGCTVNCRRNAALSTAYALSERALITYRDEVIKTIGEKKEKELRGRIAQSEVDKDKVSKQQIIITSKGNTLCKDSISGRYFKSDMDAIRKACNELNRKMMMENYISLNQFYDTIGLDHIKDGDYLGWNIDNGLIELDFDACISDTDEPCIVIDYNVMPVKGYDRF